MNEILDGEIHVLSDEWAYIAVFLDYENLDNPLDEVPRELYATKKNFIMKYINYLYDNLECEDFLRYLPSSKKDSKNFYFIGSPRWGPLTLEDSENFQFIYRPPWVFSILSQKSTFALKFKRLPNDNFRNEEKDEKNNEKNNHDHHCDVSI